MTSHEEAVRILRAYGDPACYESVVQTIVRGIAGEVYADEDGVAVLNRPGKVWMVAAKSEEGMERVLARLAHDGTDVSLHGEMSEEFVERMRERFGFKYTMHFCQYAYYGAIPEPEPGVDVRPLGLDALDFIYENYGHASREYIRERLEAGVMLGAYLDGELAAFIGEHSEGSMGLLHVMPEHRRMHLGFALERAAIRRTMLLGHTVFDQVFDDNAASQALQARLGMTRSKGCVRWLSNEAL